MAESIPESSRDEGRPSCETGWLPDRSPPCAAETDAQQAPRVLVLGIGNVLMGDEGVGVHVVRQLEALSLPQGCGCLDGGTGSLQLLEPMQRAGRVVLIDACVDGGEPGRVRRLRPRFAADYPRTLTAHDIGLRDLLDVFYLLGRTPPDVTLFAVSVAPLHEIGTHLSAAVAARVPYISQRVRREVGACPA